MGFSVDLIFDLSRKNYRDNGTCNVFLRALAGYRVWDPKYKPDMREELRITDVTTAIKYLERTPENESQGSYADMNWLEGGIRWGKKTELNLWCCCFVADIHVQDFTKDVS
jgi:hypothetical protein